MNKKALLYALCCTILTYRFIHYSFLLFDFLIETFDFDSIMNVIIHVLFMLILFVFFYENIEDN